MFSGIKSCTCKDWLRCVYCKSNKKAHYPNVPVCQNNYSPYHTPHTHTPPHLVQLGTDPGSGEVGWKTPLCHPSCTLPDWPHCGALCAADREAGRMNNVMDAYCTLYRDTVYPTVMKNYNKPNILFSVFFFN